MSIMMFIDSRLQSNYMDKKAGQNIQTEEESDYRLYYIKRILRRLNVSITSYTQ